MLFAHTFATRIPMAPSLSLSLAFPIHCCGGVSVLGAQIIRLDGIAPLRYKSHAQALARGVRAVLASLARVTVAMSA